MKYLSEIYANMGVDLDPTEEYFETDSRFMVVEEVLRSIPPGNFCDLGCGRGAVLRRLSQHHAVYGTEYDPSLVAICRAAGFNVENVDLNEAERLPFPSVEFDVALIGEVCEHLLNPRRALTTAKDALKSGGTLIVTVPNAVPLFVRVPLLLGRSVEWLHYPSADTEKTGHIRFYTAQSMSQLLREVGLVVQTVKGVSFRMNGRFWARFCYWISRLSGAPSKSGPARFDAWLGRVFPGLSPGLMFVCRKP